MEYFGNFLGLKCILVMVRFLGYFGYCFRFWGYFSHFLVLGVF